jgi:hypothetical protein
MISINYKLVISLSQSPIYCGFYKLFLYLFVYNLLIDDS